MSIILKNITKAYKVKNNSDFYALEDINIEFKDSGFYTIMGESGSGKSTLLNIISKIESQTRGKISYSFDEKKDFYSKNVSFVFQDNNLIEDLSIIENLKIASLKDPTELLKKVKLYEKINVPVLKLSGGEKQRLSLIRAILKDYKVIILDEPTLNLDFDNSKIIVDILKEVSNEKLVIISSHDENVIKYSDYLIELERGKIKRNISLDYSLYEINKNDEETILYIYKLIEIKKNENKPELIINNKLIDTENKELLKNILSNLDNEVNKITLKFHKNPITKKTNNLNKKYTKFNFNFNYSISLLKKNLASTFFIIIILIITSGLFFNLFNTIFINPSDQINKSRNNYEYSIYPIYKEKFINLLGYNTKINSGVNYYNEVKKNIEKSDIALSFNVEIKNTPNIKINNGERYTLVLFNKDNYYNLFKENNYNKNNLFITDYINEIYFKDKKNIDLKIKINYDLNIDINNVKFNIINTNYKSLDFNVFEDNLGIQKNFQKFNNKISLLYISEELFEEKIQSKILSLRGFEFLKTEIFEIFSSKNSFKKFENENIIFGNNIENENEIIVSEKYLEENSLKKEDVLNKEYNVIDLYKISSDYGSFFNLGNYTNKIIIKAVINDESSNFYLNSTLFDKISKDYKYFISETLNIIPNNNFKNNLKLLHKNNNKINYIFDEVYNFNKTKDSVIQKVVIIFSIFFIIISFSTLLSNSYLIINSKRREIAILKSLGKKNSDILKVFLYNNIIYSILALPFGFLIFTIFYKVLNLLLTKYIISIEYDLLIIYWYVYFIIGAIYLTLSFITAYIPLFKINKIDIAEIKEY